MAAHSPARNGSRRYGDLTHIGERRGGKVVTDKQIWKEAVDVELVSTAVVLVILGVVYPLPANIWRLVIAMVAVTLSARVMRRFWKRRREGAAPP